MSNNSLVKRPSECTILIVDDEEVVCEVLKTALAPHYSVTVCYNGTQAMELIDTHGFDVIVTDLKLPDVSGTEIIAYAKSRDEFSEVVMITGYATLDSATAAINLGAVSYLTKPFSIPDFLVNVEKAVASRLFHLKSLLLMKQSDYMEPGFKEHLFDITSLYYFTRKLMLSLEVSEILRIVLEEANNKTAALFCVVGVNIFGYQEMFAMPLSGELNPEFVKHSVHRNWEDMFFFLDLEKFHSGEIPLYLYKGKNGKSSGEVSLHCSHVPMIVTGKQIGSIAVFRDADQESPQAQNQFLHVFTSIVSSVIEHAYSDLLARVQAKTDSLTGIANHRQFHEALEREIARANRRKGTFALVLVDIDDFKVINDTYGHQVGDAVIIDITKRLTASIRTGDVAARYGGEEFCLILPDTDQKGAMVLSERICRSISNTPFLTNQIQLRYTASFGVAVYNGDDPGSKDVLFLRADQALYSSKNKGKNQVTLSTQST